MSTAALPKRNEIEEKYTYDRCTGYKGKCDLPRMTEAELGKRLGDVLNTLQISAVPCTIFLFPRLVTQVFFQWNIEIKKLLAVHLHPCEVHMSAGFRVIDPGDIKEDKPAVDGVWLYRKGIKLGSIDFRQSLIA